MVGGDGMSQDLLSRIPDWEREADVFEQKARAPRQLVEAVRVLNGDAPRLLGLGDSARSTVGTNQYATDEGPRGREAVRQIVAERPGVWRVSEIKQVNRERGWPSHDEGIETAVIRMAKAGEAVKLVG